MVTGKQPLFLYRVDLLSQPPREMLCALVSLKCRIRNALKYTALLLQAVFGFPCKKCPSQVNKKIKIKIKKARGLLCGACTWQGMCPGVSEARSHRCTPSEGVCQSQAGKDFPLRTESSTNQETKRNIHSSCPRQTAEEAGRSVWLIIAKTDIHHCSYDQTTSEIRKHSSRAEGIEMPP